MRPRRAFLRIAIPMLAGAGISLLVAQACVLRSPISGDASAILALSDTGSGTFHLADDGFEIGPEECESIIARREPLIDARRLSELKARSEDHLTLLTLSIARGRGVTIDSFTLSRIEARENGAEDVEELTTISAGFPWPGLAGSLSQNFRDPPVLRGALLRAAAPTRPRQRLAIRRLIPLAPLWTGLALNTACVAVPLWLAPPMTRALLRRLRLRRNHCPRCGYNRLGLPPTAPCPECGPAPT